MSYEVQIDTDTVTIGDGARQVIRCTVANTADHDLETAVMLRVEDGVRAEWCEVVPSGDRVIPARQSEIYEIHLVPVGVAAPRSGRLSLEVAWVDQPNLVFTQGPYVTATMVPSAPAMPASWVRRHGWKVLAGVGGALVAGFALALVWLSGPTPPRITSFTATPVGGEMGFAVGGFATFAWEIEGDVSAIRIRAQGDDAGFDDFAADQLNRGSVDLPLPAQPGDHVFELIARDDFDDAAGNETSRVLTVTIPEPPVTLEPVVIRQFTVSATQVAAGAPVVFSWEVSGDAARAAVVVGASQLNITEPGRLVQGSIEHGFLAGTHRALLRVLGKDGHEVESDEVVFTVTAQRAIPDIQQFRVTGLDPVSVRVRDHRSGTVKESVETNFRRIEVTWAVSGEPTSIKVQVGSVTVDLAGNQGTQTIEVDRSMGRLRDGSPVRLRAGVDGGGEVLATTEVGAAGITAKQLVGLAQGT